MRTQSVQASPAPAAASPDAHAAAPAPVTATPVTQTAEPAPPRNEAANDPTPARWKFLRCKATEVANNKLKDVISQLKRYMVAPRLKHCTKPRTPGSHPP